MNSKVAVSINGIKGQVEAGCTVLEAASQIGAGIAHLCFGHALCTTCRFVPINGVEGLSPKSPVEKVSLNYHLCFDENMRLACQAKITGPQAVELVVPKLFQLIAPKNAPRKQD
jgi:ferredoxin